MPQVLSRGSRILTLTLLLAALAIGLAAQVLPAAAQEPSLAIDRATLSLWPEYDDPGLLVILSGVFTGAMPFPQQVAFPIPAGARDIQATVVAANGDLFSQPWQIVDGRLTYVLPQPAFQIEFYLDRPPSGNQREISYTFDTNYAIKNLAISFQQPARATGFAAMPQPEESFQGSDGFTYYTISRADVAAGARLPFNLRYSKNDQGLSVAQAQLNPTNPAAASGAARNTATGGIAAWLPYALIGLGLATLAAAVGYWFWQARPASAPTVAAPPSRAASLPKVRAAGKVAFCTQCGHQFGADDRFCARCGAARKGHG